MELENIEKCDIVMQINITHNYDLFVKRWYKYYRDKVGAKEDISYQDLIDILMKKGREKSAFALKAMVDTKNLIDVKQWVERTEL